MSEDAVTTFDERRWWEMQLGVKLLSRLYTGAARGVSSAGRAPALQAGGHRFDPGTLHRSTGDEFDVFFARYAERYLASDVAAMSEIYEAPLLAVRDGVALHFADRGAVCAHLAELTAGFAASGAARAEIASLYATPLGTSGAIATVHWLFSEANGALVKDFHTTYQLLRAGDDWRILSYTNHD